MADRGKRSGRHIRHVDECTLNRYRRLYDIRLTEAKVELLRL